MNYKLFSFSKRYAYSFQSVCQRTEKQHKAEYPLHPLR